MACTKATAGADAIGLIFHPPSPRNISLDRAREIIRSLGPFVTPVGVFVDALAQRMMEVAGNDAQRVVVREVGGQWSGN